MVVPEAAQGPAARAGRSRPPRMSPAGCCSASGAAARPRASGRSRGRWSSCAACRTPTAAGGGAGPSTTWPRPPGCCAGWRAVRRRPGGAWVRRAVALPAGPPEPRRRLGRDGRVVPGARSDRPRPQHARADRARALGAAGGGARRRRPRDRRGRVGYLLSRQRADGSWPRRRRAARAAAAGPVLRAARDREPAAARGAGRSGGRGARPGGAGASGPRLPDRRRRNRLARPAAPRGRSARRPGRAAVLFEGNDAVGGATACSGSLRTGGDPLPAELPPRTRDVLPGAAPACRPGPSRSSWSWPAGCSSAAASRWPPRCSARRCPSVSPSPTGPGCWPPPPASRPTPAAGWWRPPSSCSTSPGRGGSDRRRPRRPRRPEGAPHARRRPPPAGPPGLELRPPGACPSTSSSCWGPCWPSPRW